MVKRFAFFRLPAVWGAVLMLLTAVLLSSWVLGLAWTLPVGAIFTPDDALPLDALTVRNNTLPRMLMAVAAGAASALATALLQQIMRNPLASDGTLAVGGGAQTALLLVTVFAPALMDWGAAVWAFIGALFALFAVLWLSAARGMRPLAVVLAGMVMSLYLGAVSGVITLFFSEEARGVMLWGSGSLVQDSWHDSLQLLWRVLLAAAAAAILVKPLSAMMLSDEQAASLGISVKTVRLLVLLLAAFLSANVVAVVGMLGFTGLAAATLANHSRLRRLPEKLLAAALYGALLLWITDCILMLLKHYFGWDFPAGAVSALLGAPLLLWLMRSGSMRPIQAASASSGTMAVQKMSPLLKALPVFLLIAACAALLLGRDNQGWYVATDAFLWQLRYPRLLLAAACGIMLAVCGVVLQRLTLNPMASPELLGISSGTAIGITFALMVFDMALGSTAFYAVGIGSALAALFLLLQFNHKNAMAAEPVMLTGLALAALGDAVLRVFSAGGDMRVQQLLVWLSGSTYHVSAKGAWAALILAAVLLLATLPLSRWLALLGLGGVAAHSAGVNTTLARGILVVFAAVLTAMATLIIGPLSFVGLLAPHLAALLGARLVRQQLYAAAAIGAAVMICADWLGRQLLFPYEIPAGLVSTLIGGAYFLWLMRRMD